MTAIWPDIDDFFPENRWTRRHDRESRLKYLRRGVNAVHVGTIIPRRSEEFFRPIKRFLRGALDCKTPPGEAGESFRGGTKGL